MTPVDKMVRIQKQKKKKKMFRMLPEQHEKLNIYLKEGAVIYCCSASKRNPVSGRTETIGL